MDPIFNAADFDFNRKPGLWGWLQSVFRKKVIKIGHNEYLTVADIVHIAVAIPLGFALIWGMCWLSSLLTFVFQ